MAKTPNKPNNPPQQAQAAQAIGAAFATQSPQILQASQVYQGPLPHPDILRGYDAIVPGAAERILVMAESEASSRNRREDEALQANIAAQQRQLSISEKQTKLVFRSDLIGQIFGFIICILCLAGAVYLGLHGQVWLAGVIAAIPGGAIVKAFFAEKPKPSN